MGKAAAGVPRPVESAPSYGDAGEDPLGALQRSELFRGLTQSEYTKISKAGEIVRIPQDRIVPRGGEGEEEPALYFLLKGQVAFGEFDPGKAPKGPVNPKKRPPAIMQLAHKTVALFEVGDFFANDHVPDVRGDDGVKREVALFTCVPVVLFKLPRATLDPLLASVPKLREAIDQRAEAAYYRQTFLKLENRGDLLDFYVREGLEYAGAIKVIQIDKCIDCDECVKGCEDRHGIPRIERFGPRVGLLQFTLNCRTCEDARCIEPCNFDAIGFDEEIQEVVVYDNCVGCTLCSKACPHEAIRMVDMIAGKEEEEKPIDIVNIAKNAKARDGEKPKTVIAQGEEKKAKKKGPKRIANKCDHCLGYSDLACISACPTGAIIQIDPRAIFRRDGGLIERAEHYFAPEPFEQGYAETANVQGVGFMRLLFTVVGIGVLGCFWEYFARHMDTGLSLWKQIVELTAGPGTAAGLKLTYTAATGFGRWMGYFGAGMMIVAALYTLRLHLPGLRRMGSSKTWFDFHVVFGVAGPLLALLHTDFHVMTWRWVAFLFWAVIAVVMSGLVGRFIYTAIPRAEVSTDKDRKRLDEGIRAAADQWAAMTMSANVLQQFLKVQEKTDALRNANDQNMGTLAVLGFIFSSEIARFRAAASLRFGLLGDMQNRRLRNTAIKLMSRRAAVERRGKLLGIARVLLAWWRSVHIGISIVMFVMLIVHVAISIWAMGL